MELPRTVKNMQLESPSDIGRLDDWIWHGIIKLRVSISMAFINFNVNCFASTYIWWQNFRLTNLDKEKCNLLRSAFFLMCFNKFRLLLLQKCQTARLHSSNTKHIFMKTRFWLVAYMTIRKTSDWQHLSVMADVIMPSALSSWRLKSLLPPHKAAFKKL